MLKVVNKQIPEFKEHPIKIVVKKGNKHITLFPSVAGRLEMSIFLDDYQAILDSKDLAD
ncbi:hypothetical protein RYH73_20465 [Olivibacter sp. CPCC 100613]